MKKINYKETIDHILNLIESKIKK